MKKFFKILLSVLTSIICAVCVVVLVISIVMINSDKVPMILDRAIVNVSSQSMEPTYKKGDLLIIKKTDALKLKVDDVITFVSSDPAIEGMLNTHRIFDIEDNNGNLTFVTKGDNNYNIDQYKDSQGDIVGKVQAKIPYVGNAISYLQNTKSVYFVVIILPLLVIMLFEVRNVVKKIGEAKSKDENKD